MKLKRILLKDFRAYKTCAIDFNDCMNVIIGKNDVGKSSVFDALDIFLNNSAIEVNDCNIYSQDKIIDIGLVFEVCDGEEIIIDSTNPTTLNDEYLLNQDGYFEVHKIFDASGNTITKSKTKIIIESYYPDIAEMPIITLKQPDLKAKLEEYKSDIEDYENIHKVKKADMRKALYSFLIDESTKYKNIRISIDSIQEDSLKSWDKINNYLPVFNLFQSDRTNSDGDKEVQDPMKAATKIVLSELEDKLSKITEEVVRKVEMIGERTIEKLKEFDEDISKELKTNIHTKKWDSLFSFTLDTDKGIPLNKRGSGIRRLILLSYFRAETEQNASYTNKRNVIYAIEEPETSQHPDFQKMILESLIQLSQRDNHQIMVTTHNPTIAKLVDVDSLIFIKFMADEPCIEVEKENKLLEITKTLGIISTTNAKLLICVEGPCDVALLYNLNEIPELRSIVDLHNDNISVFPTRGCNLINWVDSNHLKNTDVKEYHLYDGDVEKYSIKIDEINAANDGRRNGRITTLREMENYIPPSLIEEEFFNIKQKRINLSDHYDVWKEIDVPMLLVGIFEMKEECVKELLNCKIAKKINRDLLVSHGVYDEIEEWFIDIFDILEHI